MFLFASMPAGNILGIPIRIHWSAPAGILVWTIISWPHLGTRGFDTAVLRLASGLGVIILVALVILMHELAHSLVAGIWGVRTQGIYLHLFGGLALVMDPAALALTPGQEMAVLGAGPASNLACSLAAGLLAQVVHSRTAARMILALAGLNLAIAIFNLLPIWPLDGGQLFRAFLALIRLRSRLADWITLIVSLLVGCPYMYIAWLIGNFWAFSIFLLVTACAVMVLGFLGLDPDRAPAGPADEDAPQVRQSPFTRTGRLEEGE